VKWNEEATVSGPKMAARRSCSDDPARLHLGPCRRDRAPPVSTSERLIAATSPATSTCHNASPLVATDVIRAGSRIRRIPSAVGERRVASLATAVGSHR